MCLAFTWNQPDGNVFAGFFSRCAITRFAKGSACVVSCQPRASRTRPVCSARFVVLRRAVADTPCQSGSGGAQYARLRKQTHCDLKLSYADAQAEAAKYVGRTLELRGIVGGVAEGTQSLSVMLNLPDGNAPALEVPLAEAGPIRAGSSPHVRVLVRVAEGSSGNVLPLTVLAVAAESEIDAQDKAAEAQAALQARRAELALQERERWHRQVMKSAPRDTSPSRSSFARAAAPMAQPPISTPEVSGTLGPRVRDCYPAYYSFIYNHNRKLGANMAAQIAYYLLSFADRYNVDPRLVTAMMIAESDFDPMSTSHSGAMGLGQLMPDEVKSLGLHNGYDIKDNIYGSIVNLRSDLDSFASIGGPNGTLSIEQIRLAMATYNAGPGAVKKYKGVPPYKETQGYVKRVVRLYRQFCGLSSD